MKRYQALHTNPEPNPGLRGILRQLFVGTDIYWGDKLHVSVGRRESAGFIWRGYIRNPIRRNMAQVGLDFDKLTEAWEALPAYRKRSLLRSFAITGTQLFIMLYESRKYGFKEAIRPRFIWNLPRKRQQTYYLGLVVQLVARDVQNALNEKELKGEKRSTNSPSTNSPQAPLCGCGKQPGSKTHATGCASYGK